MEMSNRALEAADRAIEAANRVLEAGLCRIGMDWALDKENCVWNAKPGHKT